MSQNCKVWLWILFALECIMIAFNGYTLFSRNLIGQNLYMASWIAQMAFAFGVALLLFWQKRVGFFLMCIINLSIYILNVFFLGQNVAYAMISAVIVPFITWYFLKKENTWAMIH